MMRPERGSSLYGDSFPIADYLAGRLGGAAAETFERHVLECERCREQLELAALARAALDEKSVAVQASDRPRHAAPVWVGLAAAAAAILVVVTVGVINRDDGATYRGEEQGSVRVEIAGTRLVIEWPEVAGAESYRLRLFAADGSLLAERELAAPPAALETSELGSELPPAFVDVTALDGLRETLWRSPPQPVTQE